jgi:tetratricopeptide (TPR) repeat protein
MEKTYGETDVLLAVPLRFLGQVIWNQGDFKGANKIYERELKILEDALGENHASLHGVLRSLASNQRKIGSAAAAKAYYERDIKILEKSESPALVELADSYGDLGTLIMDEGFFDEAEPLIGGLFGFTDEDVTQREIIIVLTPYVLAEEGAGARSNTPKESNLFDDSDMSLSSNRYRLRGEDIFDLSQLIDNIEYLRHEFAARQAVHANP